MRRQPIFRCTDDVRAIYKGKQGGVPKAVEKRLAKIDSDPDKALVDTQKALKKEEDKAKQVLEWPQAQRSHWMTPDPLVIIFPFLPLNENLTNYMPVPTSIRHRLTHKAAICEMMRHFEIDLLKFPGQVRVSYFVHATHKTDRDNLSGKYMMDALAKCGVIPHDGPEIVPHQPIVEIQKGVSNWTLMVVEALP